LIVTQLEIAVRLEYLPADKAIFVLSAMQTLGKQLHALRNALEARK
jgi:hypothetical protein